MMDLSKGVPGARKRGAGPGRRALLQRAAIAAGVLLLMLLGLLLTEGDDAVAPSAETSAPVLAPLPKLGAQQLVEPPAAQPAVEPAVTSPGSEPSSPQVQPGGEPAVAATPAPDRALTTEPPAGTAASMAAPAATQSAGTLPGSVQDKGVGRTAAPTVANPPVAQVGRAATGGGSPGGTSGGDVRVHLGEFGPADRAVKLAAALVAEGLPASVQRRVVVGPYVGRAAATAAAERLKQREAIEGIVVPARRSGQFLVQTGVYSEARNAQAMRARLAAAKFKVVVQGRVVLGPYANRDAAEKALAKVAGKRNIAGTIVPSER